MTIDIDSIRARDAASDDLLDDPSFSAVVRDRRELLGLLDLAVAEIQECYDIMNAMSDRRPEDPEYVTPTFSEVMEYIVKW